jgi:hypothetical protein
LDTAALNGIAPLTQTVAALDVTPRAEPPPPAQRAPIARQAARAARALIVKQAPIARAEQAPSAQQAPIVRAEPEWPADQPALPPFAKPAMTPFHKPVPPEATVQPAAPLPAATPVPAPVPVPAAAPAPSTPAWPPPGDQGVMVEPYARVPAGVYLPPSAVLPSGEALAAPAVAAGRPADPRERPATPGGAESERISAADRLAQLGLPADTPRRVVAIGAVVAALGFLVPWAAVLAGSGLLGDYWTQWGLAGPGHWIVVTLLVGLAGLSLAGGRLASVPVGLPAITLATLLVGLLWPYLFGFLGHGVGIWVVLAGAILLLAGGLLDLRAGRHHDPGSTV